MALSWNEIKDRAIRFSKEWQDTAREEADAKPFLVEFFNVFGISSKRVSTFEHRVKKLGEKDGYIDLLWKGVLLVEMKSRGKDLDKAYKQATDYFAGLKEYDLPKCILVSDFEHFRLYDLEDGTQQEFRLPDLYKNVKLFGFLLGYQTKTYKSEDPVNILAAERMGKLHDRLQEIGYEGHVLEVYLVRVLFCLFAEDTSIFDKRLFQDYIEQKTSEDGSDLAAHLAQLFYILNTPVEKRLKNIDETLNQFPYVNGKLFEEPLPPAAFDLKMRQQLLDCCALDWSKISPAIFGSLFQSVMNPKERRNLGAHYTSEKNILKLIKPLFLDELWREFEGVKTNKNRLPEFHKKLSTLKFLDPACGCGNFLIITYRELRLLELEILRAMNKSGQLILDVRDIIWLDVDMVYGIEYEEFPARIAEVAMWLIDHQMNMRISQEFGQYFARLPLKKSAHITHGNALQLDWETVVPKDQLTYILGNPPFIGHHMQSAQQKSDMAKVFVGVKGFGVLDYVSAWYIKAAQYIKDTKIKSAFVSTNSISQGEQIGLLWNELINKYKIKIHFAHRTFSWSNEAKGNAAVHVVIIGFANYETDEKLLYEYEDIKGEPHEIKSKNINPYLVDAKDLLIPTRREPICNVPRMIWGNKPTDGGNFLFKNIEEKEVFLHQEPEAEKWIRPFMSGDDFIQGHYRYCLWLKDIMPQELKKLPETKKRIDAVKKMRLESSAEATRKKALTPTLFAQISQPASSFIAIPEVSSEKRAYIPIAFLNADIIPSNTLQIIPEATTFHFGILTSKMHMVWVNSTCGKLESRLRYSNSIVYNNFPWPENPSEKQTKAVEAAAQHVLAVRAEFEGSSLADLYDPLTMPPKLVKAHQDLDKAVDLCYRPQAFVSEAKRMEFLFELYEKYTAGLFAKEKPKKTRKPAAPAQA
ncbi:class I SAM-dependent DNA methyltransferase [Rufibacter sp. XAAS-G3-1]|uniref:class I SAM-dependent DNA methyltransferase n=1 Tax=Rufibacter sp. XAAS-G3-1 TaxID=2729134 RepID=UPI0015E767BE|nr:class I SAM-dependent DNA methyltransferase [Rufibacter sp. XAAS-G3-1]